MLALTVTAFAQVPVSIPTSNLSRGPGLMLKGFWFEVAASGPAPAVVMLHGCNAYDRRGVLSRRMVDYAVLINGAGMHALVRQARKDSSPRPKPILVHITASIPRRSSSCEQTYPTECIRARA